MLEHRTGFLQSTTKSGRRRVVAGRIKINAITVGTTSRSSQIQTRPSRGAKIGLCNGRMA